MEIIKTIHPATSVHALANACIFIQSFPEISTILAILSTAPFPKSG